jgi:hypothetical protein
MFRLKIQNRFLNVARFEFLNAQHQQLIEQRLQMQTICRFCSEKEKLKLLSLFEAKIDEKTLAELVNFLTGIEVN